ncbi:MAG: type IV pilus biogenesis/stability protein PilW [Thiothrix nivea]|nr:MAG: type IV pilus biogenesis/stability protein PilW [Thiothrix nivea]
MTAVCVVALTLLAGGCTSTSAAKGDRKKAAEYQAQLGAGYLQRNRLDLAQEYLNKALKSNRNSVPAQHYYALLQERLGNNKLAGTYFRRALQQDSKNPELLNNYGSFLCKTGNIQQAEKLFMQAAQDPMYKTPEFAYSNAGICLKNKGDMTRADSYLRKALAINPGLPSALFHMAELSHTRRENAKAQAFLYRYNEQNPETPETLLLCYKINSALQENRQAEQCANGLLSKFPNSTEAGTLSQ